MIHFRFQKATQFCLNISSLSTGCRHANVTCWFTVINHTMWSDFKNNEWYASDGSYKSFRTKCCLLHDAAFFLDLCHAASLLNWFPMFRGEILVSFSSVEISDKRLHLFLGLCSTQSLTAVNGKWEERGRKWSWPVWKVREVCERPVTWEGPPTNLGC